MITQHEKTNSSKAGTYNQLEQQRQNEYTPRYVILVNDMLDDFVHGKLRSERVKDIIPHIRLLLNIAKQRKIPIFYCNDEHFQIDPELRLWGEHAMKGTKGAKVIKELEPSVGDYIIPKRAYGSFDGTNLERLLKSAYDGNGADTLIITGVHTHICIAHTAYGAFIRGYNTIIVKDGVNAFTEKDHLEGLDYIHNNYGASIKKVSDIIKDLQ